MQDYLSRAFAQGYLILEAGGRAERIVYVQANRSERWSDPEEKVRAAYYAELIFRYGYGARRIGVEVTVPDRSPHDFADLVVFEDDECKRPFAVIECKAAGVSDTQFTQAVEQAWGNGNAHKFRAKYVGVVAGATRRFLDCDDLRYGALERDRNQVADLPIGYGRPPPFKYHKGGIGGPDIAPVSKDALMEAIRKCHQTLWGGGRNSPPAAFGEFCKLIFIKVRDEKRLRKPGAPYDFQIKTDETAAELSRRVHERYNEEMRREPDVFSEPIRADEGMLRSCVEHLEAINFSATDLDTKGVAFEQFLDGFFKGDFGQYFTPREVIQFCVAMVPPDAESMVLDTSCGSGGFLLYALEHVRRVAEEAFPTEPVERFRYWHDFAEHRLFGVEISDEISRVAKMNMILHDDGHTNVIAADGLAGFPVLKQRNPKLVPGAFDLVLTNPPFGAVVKAAEKGQAYLDRFELLRFVGRNGSDTAAASKTGHKAGKAAVKSRASVKTEILFLERVRDFLKPGEGKAAIVVPDGILTNGSLQGVRDWLLAQFQVLAVVSLPQETFQHSGASVKASVVFLRRRGRAEKPSDDEPVFMAAPANIGFDATGRATKRRTVVSEEATEKVEHHASDLFTEEVTYARREGAADGVWEERRRRILPDAGVLGAYRRFEAKPTDFFA